MNIELHIDRLNKRGVKLSSYEEISGFLDDSAKAKKFLGLLLKASRFKGRKTEPRRYGSAKIKKQSPLHPTPQWSNMKARVTQAYLALTGKDR